MVRREIIKPNAKEYVEKYFADRLKSEGFVCPDDESLNWYRIQNDKIVNSIVFHFAFSAAPWIMEMGHGFYPLFERNAYVKTGREPKDIVGIEHREDRQLYDRRSGVPMPVLTNLPVIVPPNGGNGIYMLENSILPLMEKATSIEACYQIHKNLRLEYPLNNFADKFRSVGSIFIDEAIYVNDTRLIPCFMDTVNFAVMECNRRHEKNPLSKKTAQDLEDWQLRKAALTEGRREEYLQILDDRLHQNLLHMRKLLNKSTD